MKKLLFLLCFLPFVAAGQVNCLSTMCVPGRAKIGDTGTLGAVFVSSKKVASITFSQIAGPSVALLSQPVNTGLNTPVDTARIGITNLVAGIYVIKVTATDMSGTVYPPGVDSLIVSAASVIPPVRTVVGLQVTIFGVVITIPAGQATKIQFSDGTTQNY